MSFIFDALKKAESERSRQSGPVLMDVRIAPRRQQLPAWAWALGCVLLANLLFLTWLLFRPNATPAAAVTSAALPASPPSPAAVVPAAVPAPASVPVPLPASVPMPAPVQIPAPAVHLSASPPPATQAVEQTLLPAIKPQAITAPAALPSVDNLPTMQDVIAAGVNLPALQLSLHVYDEVAGNRYVLLNSKRLREGDTLADGTRVERITARGVVLDAHGHRFLLVAGN